MRGAFAAVCVRCASWVVAWACLVCFPGIARAADALSLHSLVIRSESRDVRLWLTVFDAERYDLRVIDNAAPGDRPRFFDLAAAMKAGGCVAGVNGGFFERNPFNPVGLMISEGRRAGVFDATSWMKGIFVVRASGPALEASAGFEPEASDIVGLIQSGPWLVRSGRAELDNGKGMQAKRTFIGHNGRGTWVLGLCDSCSLHELSGYLRGEAVLRVIDVQEALNLDGGPSSCLWVKSGGTFLYRQEYWSVRNFVGLVAKPSVESGPAASPAP